MKATLLLLLGTGILLSSCGSEGESKTPNQETKTETSAPTQGQTPNTNQGIIKEIIHTSSYSYLLVNNAGVEVWIAIVKTDFNIGETVYYKDALEMLNFKSAELNRVFEKVLFIQNFSKTPFTGEETKPTATQNKSNTINKIELKTPIKKKEGALSIATLFKERSVYAEKKVLVQGEVAKVNAGIMGKNWIHLQDGTQDGDNYDMLITTQAENIKVGDVVSFEGILKLDQKFGGMYSYEVLIEEGIVK